MITELQKKLCDHFLFTQFIQLTSPRYQHGRDGIDDRNQPHRPGKGGKLTVLVNP